VRQNETEKSNFAICLAAHRETHRLAIYLVPQKDPKGQRCQCLSDLSTDVEDVYSRLCRSCSAGSLKPVFSDDHSNDMHVSIAGIGRAWERGALAGGLVLHALCVWALQW